MTRQRKAPTKPTPTPKPTPTEPTPGDDAVRRIIEPARTAEHVKKARQRIDGPDAAELTEAEEKGKKPLSPP
jgi:hypothetical protein